MPIDSSVALIQLADAKGYLKIGNAVTSEDGVIADLINECSQWINTYCGRSFIAPATDVTEYYDGDGRRLLFLHNWPVIQVSSLHIDDRRLWTDDKEIDLAADVMVDSEAGILTLWNNASVFYRGVGNVRLLYRGGYVLGSNVPYDLQLCCRKLVAWKYFQDYSQRRFGVSSESTGDRQINYTEEALLMDVKQILDGYRRRIV